MGDARGFLKTPRQQAKYRPIKERIKDYKDVVSLREERLSKEQASRCMDCGTPFCHGSCPLGNYIPEWNDFLFHGNWHRALKLLEDTNNLSEVTGRVCPALCEYSCVLALNSDAVTIRENELSIIEFGFKNNLIRPKKITHRTGKKVAVVGSGPAGLSCAVQLNRAGHSVTIFERDQNPGGILRYGIPDFKLEKHLLDRRIAVWKKEGIAFKTGIDIGKGYKTEKLLEDFDVVCLCCGSRVPRDINIEGRNLKGIHFAMDYLIQSNKRVSKESLANEVAIDTKGKNVVVIGGGDTGSDCVGTANRQDAARVIQIEIMPRPAECRTKDYPWPGYPMILKNTSSHEEGSVRDWSVLTKCFLGENGSLKKLCCVRVEFVKENSSCPVMREVAGSEFEIEADLAIIAAGFLHTQHDGLVKELDLKLDKRGNIETDFSYMSSREKVFSAGDMRRGQSLVVWAIAEGRNCAHYIDKYLMGESSLPLT